MVPAAAETETTVSPTRNEMRAPASTRARMSRPSSSSQKTCVVLGPSRRSASCWSAGSNGVTNGPTTAASAATATIDAPIQNIVLSGESPTGDRSFIANARIQEAVDDVDNQI